MKIHGILLGLLMINGLRAEVGSSPVPQGMRDIPGGTFKMGSAGTFNTTAGRKDFPEETPIQTVTVKAFRIDETEVTNAQFEKFVKETGYVTFAEREAKPEEFPVEARAALPIGPLHQGSIVFAKPAANPNIDAPSAFVSWWRWDPDANWRRPWGKDSSIKGLEEHPVVCVNHEDAAAYAKWAKKRLPTEAEWEFAARGGLDGKIYTWGDEMRPDGKLMANTFQGTFPAKNTEEDGFGGSAPVGKFPANGYGLRDMAGNVWEICEDTYQAERKTECTCAAAASELNKIVPPPAAANGPASHVIKGGSFLCHVSYCMRYRPAARTSQEDASPANHTGFRCVVDK